MLVTLLTRQPRMLGSILAHTPAWVWLLLAALVALGVSQLFRRRVGLRRTVVVPLALGGFSAWGMTSAFGAAPHLAAVLGLWVLMAGVVTVVILALAPLAPAGTRYDARQQQFELPGSAWPLLLIVGIFLVKYGVGVELSLQPMLAHDERFALQIALIYGVFNGLFAARAGRLLRMAWGQSQAGVKTALGA